MTPNISDIPGSTILISATFLIKVLPSTCRSIEGMFLLVNAHFGIQRKVRQGQCLPIEMLDASQNQRTLTFRKKDILDTYACTG